MFRSRFEASFARVVLAWTCIGSIPAQGSALELPPRGAGARSGSEILALIRGRSVADREALLWQEFCSGNVPDFLRQLRPVTRVRVDAAGRVHQVRFEVIPDYLALGSDTDFFRMPMTPTLGQQLADRLGCSMPTRLMVNDIWLAATVKLEPVPFSPQQFNILSPDLFLQHHRAIEQQRIAAGRPLGDVVAGIKKDVVISARLPSSAGRVIIYGWHRRTGVPIQPLYAGHGSFYADYSHGVRLVSNRVEVDGVQTTLASVLADPVLHPLLSDEGRLVQPRYQSPPPAETVPFHDAFVPTGLRLGSWRARFTPPQLEAFTPRSPAGDGTVVVVQDSRGGTDTLRCGSVRLIDQVVQADIYCDFRPQLATDGFERCGIFARDRAGGAFDGTLSQAGACYALTWDSHDGRLQCLRIDGGRTLDLLPQPLYHRSSAWRRLRIEARGRELRFVVDGITVVTAQDVTHGEGEFGIGHHEYFLTNANARGTRADNFVADVPDALRLAYRSDAPGSLTVSTTHGVPFDFCFQPLTLAPGSFPNGSFYGLDATPGALASQLATGHPLFVSVFDASGRVEVTLPVPPGLTLYGVALDLFAPLPPVAVSPPTSFMTR